MTKKQKERLLKLYEHMKQPQKNLAHKKFDFSVWNACANERNECGTNGCMAGELPAIFPKYWQWEKGGLSYKGNHNLEIKGIAEFFGISMNEACHLFIPMAQLLTIDPKSKPLDADAKKSQVVANLKRFLIIKGIL